MPLDGTINRPPPGLPTTVGDRISTSDDSASLMFDVIVIMGGINGRSNEAGFSDCFNCLGYQIYED